MKATGIKGHWPLDDEHYDGTYAEDISRNGNIGTCTGLEQADGIYGQSNGSLLFGTGGDTINCGNDSSLDVGVHPFSISFWLRPSAYSSSAVKDVVEKKDGNTFYGVAFYSYEGIERILISIRDGVAAQTYRYTDNGTVTRLQWQHVVAVKEANDLRIYIDGVEAAYLGAVSGPAVNTQGSLDNVGNLLVSDVAATKSLNSRLYDARLYSYGLNPGQAANLYQSYGV